MEKDAAMIIIAHMRSDFPTKFGVPRQSGLAASSVSRIVFEPEFRNPDFLRGIENYSHLWIIWQFSENMTAGFSPTVRPPRLGGNKRMGVFATRSPFRPNAICLSCVKILKTELQTDAGPVIYVSGADMVDNTPIYDIKPYLPYADSHPEARDDFTSGTPRVKLSVDIPPELLARIPAALTAALTEALSEDPRPAYQRDPARIYKMPFADIEVHFSVDGDVLRVVDIIEYRGKI
ncbi:MAG: tRNA (N6-threonylcarbamoyladenosine(37)-N6)-methyltransferase TrmO [Clostridia bacterium]|nr:tRNA (N6-threonylcarbamoyladenosine(37)-N6)-methyltransferase TrmO [Clostridia bacterium]